MNQRTQDWINGYNQARYDLFFEKADGATKAIYNQIENGNNKSAGIRAYIRQTYYPSGSESGLENFVWKRINKLHKAGLICKRRKGNNKYWWELKD